MRPGAWGIPRRTMAAELRMAAEWNESIEPVGSASNGGQAEAAGNGTNGGYCCGADREICLTVTIVGAQS